MVLNTIFNKHNRILLREMVITDFKLRYQDSVLGYFWSLLKPLMLFAIMYVVFVHFLRFGDGIPHFASMLLLGIVLWTFFIEVTSQGMQSIVARGDLIRKIDFPKYIIVLSGTISALINLIFNLFVVFLFMAIDGVTLNISAIYFLATLSIIYVFSLSIAFLLASLYVKYRDLMHIWEIVLQGLFYATPVIYPLQMVLGFSHQAAQILMLSPIAVLFQNAKAELVGKEHVITSQDLFSNPLIIIAPYIFIAVLCIISIWYFRAKQNKFAEQV